MSKKSRRLMKMLSSWFIFSVLLQFGLYYMVNHKVEQIIAPVERQEILLDLEAEIPGTSLENIQMSYNKEYLAYKENGTLKVFNLQRNTVVFEKEPPADSNPDTGVIYYHWLPDRDTLVYFYAKKNPNAVVTVEVEVPVTPIGTNATPDKNATTNTQAQSQEPELNEDPNQDVTNHQPEPPKDTASKPKTRTEVRYNNPQITELYTLELPPADDQETEPEDRLNRSIEGFPSGGNISQMVVSTFTNLIYLTIDTGSDIQLMEIDIMKNVRNLNHSGEEITQIAVSEKFGTLYFKSEVNSTGQIVALQGDDRNIVSNDPDEIILGNRSGTLYLGKVVDDVLVSIRSAKEDSEDTGLSFTTLWEGTIPYKDVKGHTIGTNNSVIVYTNKQGYLIEEGKLQEISLPGQENIISLGGQEVLQLTREGMSTKVKLQPISKLGKSS